MKNQNKRDLQSSEYIILLSTLFSNALSVLQISESYGSVCNVMPCSSVPGTALHSVKTQKTVIIVSTYSITEITFHT